MCEMLQSAGLCSELRYPADAELFGLVSPLFLIGADDWEGATDGFARHQPKMGLASGDSFLRGPKKCFDAPALKENICQERRAASNRVETVVIAFLVPPQYDLLCCRE